MTWFKVDDGFMDHPKVKAIPRGRARKNAVCLWIAAGLWSAKNLTDGQIPRELVAELDGNETDSAHLVRVSLWHSSGHGCEDCPETDGYVFHQWHRDGDGSRRQPTRAEVQEDRRKTAARVADWRAKKRTSNGVTEGVTDDEPRRGNAVTNALVTVPPTRPDPTYKNYSPPVVPSPTREPVENRGVGIPRGTDGHPHHEHHDNAKAVCIRWVEERKLPIAAPELLAWCYRLGNGDPWEGHRLVGRHTEAELDSARSPLATVRARLRDASPTRRDNDADVIQFEEIVGRIG